MNLNCYDSVWSWVSLRMRLFEQQRILGKEVYTFNIYEIQVAANEEITPVKYWDPDSSQSSSVHLCTPSCYGHSPALVTEPHRDRNRLSPKDDGLQTVLDMKEPRQACTLETLPKRELFDEKDSQFFSPSKIE